MENGPPPTSADPDARLPRNVWILAWVAFFNDISTEMGYWLLPQFLVTVLGAPPMAFGFIEGAAETIASFSRLLSGWLSDAVGRRKPLAAAGYTLANMVKPLLAVTHSWKQVFWIRFTDRAAKGFRAAPRDACCLLAGGGSRPGLHSSGVVRRQGSAARCNIRYASGQHHPLHTLAARQVASDSRCGGGLLAG
jgi:MFS family permease